MHYPRFCCWCLFSGTQCFCFLPDILKLKHTCTLTQNTVAKYSVYPVVCVLSLLSTAQEQSWWTMMNECGSNISLSDFWELLHLLMVLLLAQTLISKKSWHKFVYEHAFKLLKSILPVRVLAYIWIHPYKCIWQDSFFYNYMTYQLEINLYIPELKVQQ